MVLVKVTVNGAIPKRRLAKVHVHYRDRRCCERIPLARGGVSHALSHIVQASVSVGVDGVLVVAVPVVAKGPVPIHQPRHPASRHR